MTPLLLTIPEAAKALAISDRTLYRLIDTQRIEAVHIGRAVRVPAEVLERYVQDLRESA